MIIPTLIAQFSSFESQSPLTDDAISDPGANLEAILSNIFGFLTILGAVFFLVYFLIAALQWITAGGESGKVEKARNRIVNGVIGLVILVGAYAFIGFIGGLVGINILSPAEMLENITPGGSI